MKTLKYLLVTMLLLGVCSLTYSQKLSLGIFPEPQEVTISSQTYAPPHGYTLRGINNPDADAVKLLKEALPFAKSGKSLPLEIKKLKDKTPEMQRSGAYTLTITKKGITIGIVDDNSLFYAAQTLKQLAKYDEGKKILSLRNKHWKSMAYKVNTRFYTQECKVGCFYIHLRNHVLVVIIICA